MTGKYAITINHPTGCMTLVVPDWLDKADMKDIRLVFNLLMRNSYMDGNAQAIIDFNSFFMGCPDELKAEWEKASRNYQDGYRVPDRMFHPEYDAKKIEAIKSENKRLLADVKKAKAKYEKICKIKTLYEELKKKFLID